MFNPIIQVKFVQVASVAFVLAMAIGCEPPKDPSGNLTGTVTSNGEIVGDCIIAIYNPATKKSIGGKVDDSGTFEIKEIPLGTYQITLLQRTSNAAENEPFDKRIPAKFRDRKTSGLKVDIKEGDNQLNLKMEF